MNINLSIKDKRLFKLILFFPLLYLWYAFLTNSSEMRVFYFLYSALVFFVYFFTGKKISIKKNAFLFIIIIIVNLFIDILLFPQSESIPEAILLAVFFLYSFMYSDEQLRKKYLVFLVNEHRKIFYVYILYFLGIALTIFLNIGITYDWGTTSLQGPYGLAHIFAYELMIMATNAYLLYKYRNKKIWAVFAAIMVILMLLTSVRTTALSLVVIIGYYFIAKRDWKKFVYLILGVVVVLLLLQYTSLFNTLIEKTNNAAETGDSTNARLVIWPSSFQLFANSDFIHKIFGNGMQALMEHNLRYVRMRIHAHNDFLDALSGYGLVSFVLYMFSFIKCSKGRGWLGFVLAYIVLAFFNGLYADCSFVISLISFRLLFDTLNIERLSDWSKCCDR